MPTQWMCGNCSRLLREELSSVNELFWFSQPLIMETDYAFLLFSHLGAQKQLLFYSCLISRLKGITVLCTGNILVSWKVREDNATA